MTNSKKRMALALAIVLVLCISSFALVACGADISVQFMVKNNAGEWAVHQEVTVEKGAVAIPEAPAKDYYIFSGWFADEALTTVFDGKDIKSKANIKAYARYVPEEVAVTINGKEIGKQKLVDVVNNTYKPAEGLKFDGWYKDADCKVKWDGREVVKDLYAQTVAVVTINNGYEDMYAVEVAPGSVFADPAEQKVTVSGVETTLEASILKDYMSDKNLDYVDADGNVFDFAKAIEKNTTITVLWNSKLSDSEYKLNEKTGNYYLQPSSLPDAPVLSLRSDITIMVPEGDGEIAKDITVEAFSAYSTMNMIKPGVKKIIFGEGFKTIKGVSGDGACLVEEVVIPSTTKIIDGSFNNMPKLKGVNIPDGVETIIGSFQKKSAGDYKYYYLGEGYDFDINIPASVKNMAMVPNNFVFAEGSTFSIDNGYIYQATEKGKVLVSDPNAIAGYDSMGRAVADTIVVPEGVVGIQVGTYQTAFNYLMLPESFKFVNYNVNLADNAHYIYMEGSAYSLSNNMLYDATAKDDPASTMAPNAYSLTTNLGGFASFDSSWSAVYFKSGKIVFPGEAVPAELDKFGIAGDATGFAIMNGKYQAMTDETLNANIILNDTAKTVYVTTTFNDETVSVELKDTNLEPNAVKTAIISKLSVANQEEAAKALDVQFLEKNVEVALGEVKRDMFITMDIVMPAKLVINANYRLSWGDNWSTADDPSTFEMECEAGEVDAKMYDLTGLSKDIILTAVLDAAVAKTAPSYESEATPDQIKANLKWSYDNAVSVKIMIGEDEVTDFSKINLDNGDVVIDVIFEFADYVA